jgi:diguanylate cyclase (GGDEF)-like protein
MDTFRQNNDSQDFRAARLSPEASTQSQPSTEASLIQTLMSQPESSDIAEQMNATACQLSLLSGWRWAAIARLTDSGNSAQLLALADNGRTMGGFTYDMAIAPCSAIAEYPGVIHIDDVSRRYSDDKHLRHLGVLHYAGHAYRMGDERIGHIFLMHDQPMSLAQVAQIDALLQLATLHVGHRLQLHGIRDQVRDWKARAETDALTSLPNRHAFERELELQRSLVGSGARADSLLAIFDVNGLKTVNDVKGHLAGDELLRRTSDLLRNHLRRRQDEVFRIGGDEFALLTDAPRKGCEDWLLGRTASLVKKLQSTWPQSGLALGFARISETQGSRSQWLELADSRMYLNKNARSRA